MKPTRPSQENQEANLSEELEELEQTLLTLKERYAQVQADKITQAQLQQRLKHLRNSQESGIKTEIRHIKQQLEALEVNLESQLFTWGSLKEPFWQAIRFGGMGVIIGWILKSYIG